MGKEAITDLQFSICGVSSLVCGKHSLDNVDSPCRNIKLVRRRRASCPSEVHGGQIKAVDIHELMYNNFKKKEISVAIMVLFRKKQDNLCSHDNQVEVHERIEEKEEYAIYMC